MLGFCFASVSGRWAGANYLSVANSQDLIYPFRIFFSIRRNIGENGSSRGGEGASRIGRLDVLNTQ
jgi:hypothetical protein